tara:strand:+ start:2626 stop:2775 length:150 start_codon:yes stop_codon:yes gene_type:complete
MYISWTIIILIILALLNEDIAGAVLIIAVFSGMMYVAWHALAILLVTFS